MKKRQLKKILDLYVMDADDDLLVPPSVYRPEEREMEKYFSKAWRISNPEKAKMLYEALDKAREEAEAKCGCGCDCHEDGCNCGEEGCDCHHDHAEGECCCGEEGCKCGKH